MSTNTFMAATATAKLCIATVTTIRLNFLSMHKNLARMLQQQHTQYNNYDKGNEPASARTLLTLL